MTFPLAFMVWRFRRFVTRFVKWGMQLFNVLLGGTLYQDIPAQFTKSTLSHQPPPPYNRVAHQVRIEPGSPLHEVLAVERLGINSCHHQGIAELAPELIPMAQAEDGLIEGVCMKNRPCVGAVQWHPEDKANRITRRKFFTLFTPLFKYSSAPDSPQSIISV
ncbi:hypothetical protein Holit_02217 [Hollandina sp. SP2]